MKIKILFQLSSLGYGGTEKAIYTFLENIDRTKFEPSVFFYTDYKTLPYYRRLVKSFFFKKAKKSFIEKYTTNMARFTDFQIILENTNFYYGNESDFIKAIHSLSPNIIHFNRGVEETFFTQKFYLIPRHIKLVESNIFGKSSNSRYLNRINKIFFVSKWLIQQSPWAPNEKTALLYNPIKLPSTDQTLRSFYNIPDNAIVLGRMSRPNLDDGTFIANVLTNVLDNDIYFLVIGASEILRKTLADLNNIIFIDPTTDTNFISIFYNKVDLLLHYRKEGETFGMNIAEAMIHGKPVISHQSFLDNAQIELLLGESNVPCGIVVKENDTNAYIQATKELIIDTARRKTLGENAHNRAIQYFAENVVARHLENSYLSII